MQENLNTIMSSGGSWPDGQSMYEEWGSYLNDYEKPVEVADCKKSGEPYIIF